MSQTLEGVAVGLEGETCASMRPLSEHAIGWPRVRRAWVAPVGGALLAPAPALDGRAVGRVDGCCRRRAHRRGVRGGRTRTGTADDLYAVCRAPRPPPPSCASPRIGPPGVPPPAGMAGRGSETGARARGDALCGARGARCRP